MGACDASAVRGAGLPAAAARPSRSPAQSSPARSSGGYKPPCTPDTQRGHAGPSGSRPLRAAYGGALRAALSRPAPHGTPTQPLPAGAGNGWGHSPRAAGVRWRAWSSFVTSGRGMETGGAPTRVEHRKRRVLQRASPAGLRCHSTWRARDGRRGSLIAGLASRGIRDRTLPPKSPAQRGPPRHQTP